MRNLKTIENRVLAVLKEHPEARNDDMKLYLLISKACIYDTHGISHFSFEDVMSNYKASVSPALRVSEEQGRRFRRNILNSAVPPKYAGQGTKCSVSIQTTLKAKMGGKRKWQLRKAQTPLCSRK